MEQNNQEFVAVQETSFEREALKELNELELALVGGGSGDISLG